ncbi:amine oxidase [Poronia punctata]|nr:amine oxidase [Poronia punctata]
MSLQDNPPISIRDQWARHRATHGIREVWNDFVKRAAPFSQDNLLLTEHELPDAGAFIEAGFSPGADDIDLVVEREVHIGIVGAGAAGLFTAMVLDYLNEQLSKRNPFSPIVRFTYEIYEASSEERLGGRLFTYKFSEDDHNYYDVGAMRFPDNAVMKRVFDLFGKLDMKKTDLSKDRGAPDGSIVPYYMSNNVEPWRFNDITLWGSNYDHVRSQSQDNDPFLMVDKNDNIPKILRQHSPGEVMKAAIEPLRKALQEDLETGGRRGWDLLMKYDACSTREFLGRPPPGLPQVKKPGHQTDIPPPPYNYDTIQWMETFNGGTDWYDQAHSETVLENLDFDYDDKTNWYCILGGAQELAKRMYSKIEGKVNFNSPVTAIRRKDTMKVDLEVGNSKKAKSFDAVFNTTTLACLGKMDISEANLNYATKQAARSLGYGQAAKVAIQFSRAWWIHDLGEDYNIKQGGLGHSDLMIRTCVYPSYNIYVDKDKPAVLLCSYTWQQDSQRLASQFDSPDFKELLFRELARLHKTPKMTEKQVYDLIEKNYMTHHRHDWSKDPTTMGAFAFFRPQEFSCMWPKLIHPSGDVVIVGEAASPHHAWVVGALESVIHGLHSWMGVRKNQVPGLVQAMEILKEDLAGNPFTGLPPYMDANTSEWSSIAGLIGDENPAVKDRLVSSLEKLRFQELRSSVGKLVGGVPLSNTLATLQVGKGGGSENFGVNMAF